MFQWVINSRLLTALLISLFVSACSGGGGSGPPPESVAPTDSAQANPPPPLSSSTSVVIVDDQGSTSVHGADLQDQLELLPLSEISETEAAELAYMREEEKLAYDLYIHFYEQWGQRIFSNISEAELTHTRAVLALLERYNIADPASVEPGVFTNIELQGLYDFLQASGSATLIDALLSAATVEEVDILDLRAYLLNVEGNENLLKGSRNHLRAFVRNLSKQGISYTPTHLAQEEFDAIISGEIERG